MSLSLLWLSLPALWLASAFLSRSCNPIGPQDRRLGRPNSWDQVRPLGAMLLLLWSVVGIPYQVAQAQPSSNSNPKSTYSAVGDFSLTQSSSSVWQYGYYNSPTSTTFVPYTALSASAPSNVEAWSISASGFTPPFVARSTSASTNSYLSIVHAPDMLNLHAGPGGQKSVLRWRSPAAGTISVEGSFQSMDMAGATTDVAIKRSSASQPLLNTFINVNNQPRDAYFSGAIFAQTITVTEGETIDFIVGYGNGGYGADSTGLRATITYNSGPASTPNSTYNTVNDFSLTQSSSSAWQYGYTNSPTSTAFVPYTQTSATPPANVQAWAASASGFTPPFIARNTSAATTHYSSVAHPPDMLNLHPGPSGQKSVLRWLSPAAGTVLIEGRFQGLSSHGTTTDVAIRRSGSSQPLLDTFINLNGQSYVVYFSHTLTVAAGETIDFIVGYGNGGYGNDSTGLRATITYSAGPTPTSTPTPGSPLDARIRTVADTTWQGTNVFNTTGSDQGVSQGVEVGDKATYFVTVKRNSSNANETVRLSVVDFANFEASVGGIGSVRFFKEASGQANELDITDSIISTSGWTYELLPGQELLLRLEATVGSGVTVGSSPALLIKATDVDGQANPVDVVKAELQVVASYQPDVILERLDDQNQAEASVGAGVINNDAQQTLSSVVARGEHQTYRVRIKNTAAADADFIIKMLGGTGQPWAATGWTSSVTIEGTTTSVEGPLQSATGWSVSIPQGQTVALNVVLDGVNPLPTTVGDSTFKFTARKGAKTDTCIAQQTLQWIEKLQWSQGGAPWTDITPTTHLVVEQEGTISLQAVRANPAVDWPDSNPLGPHWTWQGRGHKGANVTLAAEETTGATSTTAVLGLQHIEVPLNVVPARVVTLSVSKSELLAGVGPSSLTSTTVTVKVTDPEEVAIATAKIRLKAVDETGNTVGQWNGTAVASTIVTTDAQGTASATWTSGASIGQIHFEAVSLDDDNQPYGEMRGLDVQTSAPYTRTEFGAWTEQNGAWNRTASVSTWFMGHKVPGRSLSLVSQIKDYETEQIVTGWQNAAPFDASTGTTNVSGDFSTVQRWNPVETDAWPHDFLIESNATVN